MDTYYGIPNSNFPKRSSLSPIQNYGSPNRYYHQPGYMTDPYASPGGHNSVIKSLHSPYHRYMQSARSPMGSPMSAGDYPPVVEYKYHRSNGIRGGENLARLEPPNQSRSPFPFGNTTPAKGEEGVLVMDGVLVKKPSSDRSRSSSLSLTDTGSSSSSSSSGKNYKQDFCVSYVENSGYCRHGTKCQFAHGNKELRPSPVSYKSPHEFAHGNKELHPSPVSYKSPHEIPCKNYSAGTCSFGSKCRFLHYETSTTSSSTVTTSAIKQDEPTSSSITKLKSINWAPADDGIDIQTSDEDFDACVNRVLCGPRRNNRLSVFSQICPE